MIIFSSLITITIKHDIIYQYIYIQKLIDVSLQISTFQLTGPSYFAIMPFCMSDSHFPISFNYNKKTEREPGK